MTSSPPSSSVCAGPGQPEAGRSRPLAAGPTVQIALELAGTALPAPVDLQPGLAGAAVGTLVLVGASLAR